MRSQTGEKTRWQRPSLGPVWRRRAIGGLVVLLSGLVALDVLPTTYPPLLNAREHASRLLDRLGLWQGPWTLFAPNPIVRNGWLSASVLHEGRRRTVWRSPYWADDSAWEKFYRFRHLNYYNRLDLPRNAAGLEDLADYLMRNLPPQENLRAVEPVVGLPLTASVGQGGRPALRSLDLYRNRLQMQLPADEPLPPRDETVWTSSSELVMRRGDRR
ncbi:MAG: hypothetical protein AAF961_00145 [Planctomycetota bacterium]